VNFDILSGPNGKWLLHLKSKFLIFVKNNQMTIKEAQEKVDAWIKTTGVRYFSELTNMAILTEEVGEVARIISRKYGDQSFKNAEEKIDLADEMADVLWVLICLANQTGVDLTEALEKNMLKKTKRDMNRHKNNMKL
jgi:NTP pyrophosphatase (non-canonical NTP hydrolase)